MNNVLTTFFKRGITNPTTTKLILSSALFTAILTFLAMFKGFFNGDFIAMMIATWVINLLIILYGISQKASPVCISGICGLNLCAAATRALLNPGASSVTSTILFMVVGVLVVCVFGFLHRFFASDSKTLKNFALFATLGLFVLCLFMKPINSTKAWLVIGGRSILQLTELAKLFYVLYIGTLFFEREGDDWTKLIPGAVVTAICAVMLLLEINEMGTFAVMACSFFCLALLKLKRLFPKFILCLFGVAIVTACIGMYFFSATNLSRWKCPECATVNTFSSSKCSECEVEKRLGGHTFRCPSCRYTTWDEAAPKSATENCELCQKNNFFSGSLGLICKKMYDRFNVVFQYDNLKGTSEAYHMEKSMLSIRVGQLFGDQNNIVHIPSADTDSVLSSLINRLGLVFVLFILFAFAQIFTAIRSADSPLRIMAIFTISFQALFTFLGTLNLIPLIGIGVPLISRGGSNLVVCYLFLYLILTAKHTNNEVIQ